jgi:hypothetical protein
MNSQLQAFLQLGWKLKINNHHEKTIFNSNSVVFLY